MKRSGILILTLLAIMGSLLNIHPTAAVATSSPAADSYTFTPSEWTMPQLEAHDIMTGATTPADPQSVLLRQLSCVTVEPPAHTEPIQSGHIKIEGGKLVISLNPGNTCDGGYSSSEWAFGTGRYLEQAELEAAFQRGDVRVFGQGSTVKAKFQFDPIYEQGTAKGSGGIGCQSWQLNADNTPAYFGWGIFYMKGSVIIIVADFSTGFVRPIFLPSDFDASIPYIYEVRWPAGSSVIEFVIDGVSIGSVETAGQLGATPYCQSYIWMDSNGFSDGLAVLYEDGVRFEQPQSLMLDWYTITREPISTN